MAAWRLPGILTGRQTLELVNHYFGDLPPGPPVRRIGRFDSGLAGRVELEIRDRVSLPRLYIAWPALPESHPDEASLELLRAVLADGQSSRLYRTLVYDRQIAQSVGVRHHSSEISGQFMVDVTAAAGHSLDELEEAVDAEIARLWQEPPTDEELARVKNRLESSHFRQLSRIGGFGGRADALNYYNTFFGNPELINTSINDYLAVQREDILRVGREVLDHRQVRLRVLPEASLNATVAVGGIDRTVMPSPAREPEFTPPVPERRQLPNGMRVTVVEKRGLPIVSFALMLQAGAITDPPELPGLAYFTTQLLPEGTETRSSQDIANAFEFIGARLSTETRREISLLSSETLTKHWVEALELLSDVAQHPTFPEHELERVRREHLTDIRRGKDDPTFIAEQIVPGLIFGRESRYGHVSLGTEESVAAFTRENLVEHFRSCYGPATANLVVVGDISLEEVMQQADAVFGRWNNPATAAAAELEPETAPAASAGNGHHQPTTIYLVDKPGAAQSVIRASHDTVPRSHPTIWACPCSTTPLGASFRPG